VTAEAVLAARNISRQYPGTLALDRVSFQVHSGRVHALMGQNGAGKTTLMRILAGEEQPSSGDLEMAGRTVRLTSARDAAAQGIAMIHQDLSLLPNLSVADNLFLGRERTRFGIIRGRAQERHCREVMSRLALDVDPRTPVGDLPLGARQTVEIAKAVSGDIRVLIMDEPTAALSGAETEVLFRLIAELKARGVAIVYISHRLEELLRVGDSITVLRDGRVVAEAPAELASVAWMVANMTGAAETATRGEKPLSPPPGSRPILEVAHLRLNGANGNPILRDIFFTARAGEMVGFYGLLGAGRTELFECLIGLRRASSGSILLDGRALERLGIPERIASGMALMPEDRQAAGIVPTLSVRQNMTLASLRRWSQGPYLSPRRETRATLEQIGEFNIRAAGPDAPIVSLSGGNQQKVVLSRYLLTSPKVLLIDEPTRGVDVGARSEIYAALRRLAAQGMAILFTSSELKEILTASTRVVVMAAGRIRAEFPVAHATEERLVNASSPGMPHPDGGDCAYA
jgi:ABC-type sugar transport system ATPase subunit